MDNVGRWEGLLCPLSWAPAVGCGVLGPGRLCVSSPWHSEGLARQLCLPKPQEVPGALGEHWDPSSCQVCSMGSPVDLGQPNSKTQDQECFFLSAAFPWLQQL